MQIKLFGEIDPHNLEEYYETEIVINKVPVEVDLNFESEIIAESELILLNKYIANIESGVKKAFEAISVDFGLGENSETAVSYLQHHLEMLTEEEKNSLFDNAAISKQIFLNSLELTRIGLYPEDEESYAIYDIHFPKKYTNYLMAVEFNKNDELSAISFES